MIQKIPRVLFAAPASGSGKTTVTCGVLKALQEGEYSPMAFKCGPDYIDPMFHTKVLGLPSRNLDGFLLSENTLKYLFAENMNHFLSTKTKGIAVLEGVMGYYDGLSGTETTASTYDVARMTKTPVILIVDAKGASLSIAATIKGFSSFKKDSNIAGVILNRTNQGTYQLLKAVLEKETEIPLLGFMPEMKEAAFESRHLGLITASEVEDLEHKISILGNQAKESIDLPGIIKIAQSAQAIEYEEIEIKKVGEVRIAVAKDQAFCFYYQDSLELLERFGAELIFFSPMNDCKIPECDGIFLGGGYPEIYAAQLSGNSAMREEMKTKIQNEIPCFAECGGFMYLLSTLSDIKKEDFEMVGAIKGHVKMSKKLERFGYVNLKAKEDCLLCKKGDEIKGHEFHYSDSDENGQAFTATKPSGKTWECIHGTKNIFAGYPHLHLWGNIKFGENFVKACEGYKRKEAQR